MFPWNLSLNCRPYTEVLELDMFLSLLRFTQIFVKLRIEIEHKIGNLPIFKNVASTFSLVKFWSFYNARSRGRYLSQTLEIENEVIENPNSDFKLSKDLEVKNWPLSKNQASFLTETVVT